MTDAPVIAFDNRDGALLLAPHPDDETIAAGGLIQRVLAAGARLRVLYSTDGDNNVWMHRLLERRWDIGPKDRAAYGARRRVEALAALAELGVEPSAVAFMGEHDLGLTDILLGAGAGGFVDKLAEEIKAFAPTIIVIPSSRDLHPDHSALAVLARLALDRVKEAGGPEPRALTYLVHGRAAPDSLAALARLDLTEGEVARKRNALARHVTQTVFRRSWFLGLAKPAELFSPGLEDAAGPPHPVRGAAAGEGALWLRLAAGSGAPWAGRRGVRLLLARADGDLAGLEAEPGGDAGKTKFKSTTTGALVGEASRRRDGRGEWMRVPSLTLGAAGRVFVKTERPSLFFDEGGWREVPVPGPSAAAKSCAVIPCYNVGALCADVARRALERVDHLIAVDDGSTDGTAAALRGVVAASEGRMTLLQLSPNAGKGNALMAAFRFALETLRFEALVTLDGDGQHEPAEIPLLLGALREGAEFVVGQRLDYAAMPWKSKFGNLMTKGAMRAVYPACPADTQSGFRAMDRAFVERSVARLRGSRYETELEMLLLAMDEGVRLDSVPISTIYLGGNRASHFRPLADSARIYASLIRWLAVGRRRRPEPACAGKV